MRRHTMAGLMVCLGTLAHADTLLVPQQYPTIQAALDAAQDGDEVVLADGQYTGPGFTDVVFPAKDITLRSAGGPSVCGIVGPVDDIDTPMMRFHESGPPPLIEGLTLSNADLAVDDDGYVGGSAVSIIEASPVFRNCEFVDNRAFFVSNYGFAAGGAVWMSASDAAFIDCVFRENRVSGARGGAVAAQDGSHPIFEDCVFDENESVSQLNAGARGGAIAIWDSDFAIVSCDFVNNSSHCYCEISPVSSGGAVWINGGSGLIADSTFASHTDSCRTVGSAISAGGSTTIVNCLFTGNRACGDGYMWNIVGSVVSLNATSKMINCTLVGNVLGGFIEDAELIYGTGTVTNCIVSNNGNLEVSPDATVTWSIIEGGFPGPGNIDADPMLHTDHTPLPGSPAIDAGNTLALPTDVLDRDADGDTSEPWPVDVYGDPRLVDDPDTIDTGLGGSPVVDIGAIEYRPPTLVGNDITASTAWTPLGSPYLVTDKIAVTNGATLTIEPGVTVRFEPETRLAVGTPALGAGTLLAVGTPESPIVFTPTTGDPAPGDWDSIRFTPYAVGSVADEDGTYISGSRLAHCDIRYAGANQPGAVTILGRSVHIERCTISHALGRGVAGVDMGEERLVILDSLITECHSSLDGGGVYIDGGVGHLLRGSTFLDNTAPDGAGVFALGHDGAQFESLIFDANHADLNGGAMWLSGNHVISGSSFENNSASLGGALYAVTSTLQGQSIEQCTFEHNDALHGGALYIIKGTVSDCDFFFNSAALGAGGIRASQLTVIEDCHLAYNTALNGEGGAIYASGGALPLTLAGLQVNDNFADSRGGGLRLIGTVDVIDSVLASNSAERGGGAFLGHDGPDAITFTNTHITGNAAVGGAGIRTLSAEGTLIESCTIDFNVANNGGGIMLGESDDVLIVDSLITGNSGSDGGGIWSNSPGAALSDGASAPTMIFDNDASRGAAIFYAATQGDMDAAHVCWNASNPDLIAQRIWDHEDDPALGSVNYLPFEQCGFCIADCDDNGQLNILDFVCFQTRFLDGDPETDCTGDGVLNILDFVCFQQAFVAGCP